LLQKLLDEINVNQETFLLAAKKGLESEDKKFYEQLIACDNFLYFKNMMIKRNMQLEEEAMKLMQSKAGDLQNKHLTGNFKQLILIFKIILIDLIKIFNFLILDYILLFYLSCIIKFLNMSFIRTRNMRRKWNALFKCLWLWKKRRSDYLL